jgi:Zn-dependent membrane protease YugP
MHNPILYIALIVGTMLLGFYASWKVKSSFRKHSRTPSSSGLTGAQVAQQILRANGIYDVEVVPVAGELTDHYDPSAKRLALSEPVYYSNSLAAQGVSAHECGHALQHAQSYAPLHWRMAAVGITNFGNKLIFVAMLGLLFIAPKIGLLCAALGFGIIMIFNLITLPVEFDASNRAKKVLADLRLVQPGPEAAAVNTVLSYVLPLLTGRSEES